MGRYGWEDRNDEASLLARPHKSYYPEFLFLTASNLSAIFFIS
jgi:hypothetical protein